MIAERKWITVNRRLLKKNYLTVKLLVCVFIAVCLFGIIKIQFEYNALKEEMNALELQKTELNQNIEELQKQLDAPFDEKYVQDIARDQLNYALPDEIIYYNDLYN